MDTPNPNLDQKYKTIFSNSVYCPDIVKIKHIATTLKIIGFDKLENKDPIERTVFETKLNELRLNGDIIKKQYECCKLFDITKKQKFTDKTSIKSYIGYINSFLDFYGMCIKAEKKRIKKNTKRSYINSYKLTFINEINIYL
jgi:hypothetical protein